MLVKGLEGRVLEEVRLLLDNPHVMDISKELGTVCGNESSDHDDAGNSGEDGKLGGWETGEKIGESVNSVPGANYGTDLWQEQYINPDYALQEVEVDTSIYSVPLSSRSASTMFMQLFHQPDTSIEVDIGKARKHPTAMVNLLGENRPNPFISGICPKHHHTLCQSLDTRTNWELRVGALGLEKSWSLINSKTVSACITFIHALCNQVAMPVKGIILILQVAGCADAASHILRCINTIYSFLDIDDITLFILPICMACNDVILHDPTGLACCHCCDENLYTQDQGANPGAKPQCCVHFLSY